MSLRKKLLGLRGKLLSAFLAMALLPFVGIGWIAYDISQNALQKQAMNQLVSVREIKKTQIERFFEERRGDMGVLIETVDTLRQEAFQKLTAVREVKRSAIERYFQSITDQIITFSEDRMIVDAMKQFQNSFYSFQDDNSGLSGLPEDMDIMRRELLTYYTGEFYTEYQHQNPNQSLDVTALFQQLDEEAVRFQYHYIRANQHPLGSKHLLDQADDYSTYSKQHGTYHPIIRNYLKKFGYYDIFLVDIQTGDIVYSVFKELDYGTSLLDGPYAQTNFGEAFRQAKDASQQDAVVLVDYARYTPSYEAPASFIASPIFDGQEKIGVAMFQMPIDRVNAIMGERAGLGISGETYLVGPDFLMRSDSYLDPTHHSVIASFRAPEQGRVETMASREALSGDTNTKVILDYNGNPVLSAYTPVKVGHLTWALLAEIDVAEAFSPVDLDGNEFYAQYTEMYGYYDLFLINPDGYVFYTVAKEADYQTNMLNGAFSDSNLGELVQTVLKTRTFGIADFKPYAPSNNEPAAFIAEPVVHQGNVEVIVALQLSLDAINTIMTQREGLGESGETYLVGSDNLMRSDSFLDSTNRTVVASFAHHDAGRTEKGSVITDATKAAFAGQSGQGIIRDYNGEWVLSAYTPLNIHGLQWAVIAEINKDEAFQPVYTLRNLMLMIGGGVVIVVLILAIVIPMGILRQVGGEPTDIAKIAQQIAQGDLDVNFQAYGKRTVGIFAAIQEMTGRIRAVITELERLLQVIQQGELNDRGRAQAFKGSWRDLIEGTNKVIDAFMDPFTATAEFIDEITQGNIDLTITRDYQGDFITIKENLNRLSGKLREIIGEIQNGTAVMVESVQNLTVSAQEISSTSTQQAAAVKEIVSTMEDSDRLSRGMASKAQDVTEITNNTKRTVHEGVTMIQQSLGKMDEIKEANTETLSEIRSLGEKLTSIWEIVNMINNIADQTKIIAFNAELEAASAGEAGKNFQIVASEIRRLADSTVSSTAEIRSKITEIQQSSDRLIITSEGGTEKIVEGWELSQQLHQIFEQILKAADTSDQATTQIAQSLNQQVSAFEQILIALKQISEGIDNFVVATRATSTSATQLQEIADSLRTAIDNFTG